MLADDGAVQQVSSAGTVPSEASPVGDDPVGAAAVKIAGSRPVAAIEAIGEAFAPARVRAVAAGLDGPIANPETAR